MSITASAAILCAKRISDMARNGLTETLLMSLVNYLGMYLMLSDMENASGDGGGSKKPTRIGIEWGG